MNLNDPWMGYWGMWSEKKVNICGAMLTALGVRFTVTEHENTKDILEEWCAWDPSSSRPNIGFDLWIDERDRELVGYRIVEMFPERKFEGAPNQSSEPTPASGTSPAGQEPRLP
jgi:hypothetical protein